MILSTILFLFGIYHHYDSQIRCAKYEHSMVNGHSARSNHSVDVSDLKGDTLKSLFINLEMCLKGLFTQN